MTEACSDPAGRHNGSVRRLLLSVPLVLIVLAGTDAGPALAHGDEGTLEVVDAVPSAAGDQVTYTLELTYANDGEPVDGARVSATVRGPGAGPQQPVALASIGGGWYAGAVTFPGPGRFTVAFAALEPAATLEAVHEVDASPPSTTTTAPTTTTPPPEVDPALVADDNDIDKGPPAGLIVGAVVAGAVLVATVIVLILRRRPLD